MMATNPMEGHSLPLITSIEIGSNDVREVILEVEEVVSASAKEKGKGKMSKWATSKTCTSPRNVTSPR